MSGFEPSLPCLCFFRFFVVLFLGEWVHGRLSNVLFTAAVGLQMSGFEPFLLCFVILFALFSVLFLGG